MAFKIAVASGLATVALAVAVFSVAAASTPVPVPGAPQVTILVVPGPLLPEDLSVLPRAAVGLMSPGLGDVPAEQTWLDVSQGARAFDRVYDTPLDGLSEYPGTVYGWGEALRRAASAGVGIKPGIFATSLRRSGIRPATAQPAGNPDPASLALTGGDGRLEAAGEGCPGPACGSPVTISTAGLDDATRLFAERGPAQMIVVIERPPVESGDQLAVAIAGPGFSGMLRSASTRTPGYVLSTDLAPTVLAYFGIDEPKAMTGLAIESGGRVDFASLASLEGRYQQVGKRKGTAMLFPLLGWFLLAATFAFAGGGRFRRPALAVLCLSVVLLPAALLVTAALSPSAVAESVIAGVLPVAIAVLLVRLRPGFDGLALACAITVSAFAIDLVAGLHLTPKAVIGPNPGLGARFYGIGNELESTLMILTSIGTGAALQSWGRNLSRGRSATVFLMSGLLGTLVFALGRFGADVGAAIIFPLAGVVGAAIVARRPRLVWLGAVAAGAAVLVLALADRFTGGETHFVRSIFEGGSSDTAFDVLAHRLETMVQSFTGLTRLPATTAAVILIALAWHRRKWLQNMLSDIDALRAGLVAAAVGSLVGAVVNDSGVLFIHVGVLFAGLAIAFIWAVKPGRTGS